MRGRCMAVVVGCNWGLRCFVGPFPTVLAKLGADGALAIWFGCGVLALGFCWLAVPETLATTPEASSAAGPRALVRVGARLRARSHPA